MKITVTKEFGSPEEAAAWLRVFSGEPVHTVVVPRITSVADANELIEPILGTGKALPGQTPEKKPRKPRNDAGKPRGPYKTNGGPAASEPGTTADSVATTPAAPVSPTNAAAPEKASAEASKESTGATVGVASTAPAAAAPLTEADARAALKRINQTPGLGMEAVMTHLRDFGVNRITLLKPEQYAAFIQAADEKIAAVTAAAARDAKAPK